MKRFALVMSTGLALAVVVAAAQALQAPERAPVAPIELPATAAQGGEPAETKPSTRTATPKPEIRPEIRPPATRRHATVKHVVNVVRTEPRAPARTQSLPAPPTGGGGDADDDDVDDDDDD
jgi:hypothetical protein